MSIQFIKNKNEEIKSTTKKLYLIDLELTELPKIHKNITHLYCYNNKLESLPKFHEGLEYLDCSNNNIKKLSKLPKSLKTLVANDNKFYFDENKDFIKKYFDNDLERNEHESFLNDEDVFLDDINDIL